MAVNDSVTQNLLPVQAYFDLQGNFQTFIGQNQPFYATVNPVQSGLTITNSTIDSSIIGGTTPAAGTFTSITTTTGTISTSPSGNTDITNKLYVDTVAQGLGPKQACQCGTLANITLSGLQTIDGYTTLAGDRVLVKNQTTQANNGIYIASAGAWSRSADMDVWSEVSGAYTVVLNGSQAETGWVCTSPTTGTIGVTAITWVQFSTVNTYYAGTGLTLSSNTFSITNTGVSASTYGSASAVPVLTTNAQGQVTSVTNTSIAIANTQVSGLGTMSTQNANSVAITGGSINGTTIGGSSAAAITGTTITATSSFSGSGSGLTGTASGLSIGGNAATATYATTAGSASTATTATTATNLAGGSAGALPYQTSSGSTTFLSAGSNGQYLTLSSGVPVWTSLPSNVSSFSAGTTGFTPSTSTTGAVTLSGTLNVANGGTGVTSSSGANSVVLRDANGNITTNCLFEGFTSQAASGTTITLTAASPQNLLITGSGGQTIKLPNATTLPSGATFAFNNNQSSGAITVINNSSTTIATIQAGGYVTIVLLDNSLAAGTWDRHDSTPSNVSWSTNTLDYPGSITSATWNGSTIAYNRGGTGQSSAFVAGGIAYGASTTALAISAAGTTGQVLTSGGTGAPTWSTPTAYATVTDDTTTNGTRYPLFANQTSGNLATEYTSSTKLQFNPSTGVFTATSFSGAGTGLTGTASSLSIGGNAATATSATSATTSTNLAGGLAGYLPYQSAVNTTTFLAPGTNGYILTLSSGLPTWAAAPATGVTITDDTSSATAYYPLFARVTSGTATTEYTSSTKLNYTPSTGLLAATSFSGAGTGLTGTASSLSIGGNAATATSATTATNIAGGTNLQIPYQTGAGATSFITAPTIASTYLQYNGTGFVWATAASGGVTSVLGTAPINVSTTLGVATVSITQATTSTNGYLSSTDWNTFNNKQPAGTYINSVSGTTNQITASTTTGAVTLSLPTSITTGQYIANQSISGSATQGAFAYGTLNASDTGIFASYQTSIAGYAYMALQNTSSNATATTDIALYNDTASLGKYIDIGINSSAFTGTGNFSLANAGYIYTNGGDLALGTYSANGIHFIVNNGASDAMTISSTGVVSLGTALAVGSGGTGSTTLTANNVLLGNGTSALQVVAPGTSGNVLTSNGTTWVSSAPGASGATVTSTTSTGPYYIVGSSATSGSLSTAYVNTGISYNASTGDTTTPQVVASNGIFVNNLTVGATYSIPSGYSAHSVGPVTVASGRSVTVPSGSRWVIL